MKSTQHHKHIPLFIVLFLSLISILAYLVSPRYIPSRTFDGERAYDHVIFQTELGPRTIGSESHTEVVKWLQDELSNNGWDVNTQEASRLGVRIQNVVAKRGAGNPWIVLGTHYDSRSLADKDSDPNKARQPVPGANDGASGVAVLMELSRILSKRIDIEIWLVFFDAEDNGNIQGQDWILGSRAFVDELEGKPDAVVIIDMIGDIDLNIHWERYSDIVLLNEIWDIAHKAGYESTFISSYKYRIIDDHIPFIRADIPAIDIIDFDYPYYHTSEDTADKVSPTSLAIIGDTLYQWIMTIEEQK